MNDAGRRNAVVLVSGGLDSTTTLAIAAESGFRLHALTVRYGQRHAAEIRAAEIVARRSEVDAHRILDLDLGAFGGSALTDPAIPVPRAADVASPPAIPVTYVPARNTVLLAVALAWAEVIPAADIFIGVNALDYSGYPDCRPEFIAAFERVANLGTRAAVEKGVEFRIHAPLIALGKGEIIRRGLELGVDYSATVSCYDPDDAGVACGRCDACVLRLRGFADAGVADPVAYRDTASGAPRP
jgi:7-cyano-7-deazaguanine synthase